MNMQYATIVGPGKILSQGIIVEKHNNGEVTIDIFGKKYKGFPAINKD